MLNVCGAYLLPAHVNNNPDQNCISVFFVKTIHVSLGNPKLLLLNNIADIETSVLD